MKKLRMRSMFKDDMGRTTLDVEVLEFVERDDDGGSFASLLEEITVVDLGVSIDDEGDGGGVVVEDVGVVLIV